MAYRRGWVGLVFSACMLMPAVTSAQPRWTVTVNPASAPVYAGQCTAIWLRIIDLATDMQPRNPAAQLITIADFDMTVAGGGAVVGRYNGASMWSACACPGSAGKVARITAKYPAKSLPVASRVSGVTVSATTDVTVLARRSSGVPIGCESVQTKTNPSGGTAPWTVTLTTSTTPLPQGICTLVSIDLRDATGKEEPRDAAGRRVEISDFHMAATGNGVVGGYYTPRLFSVCACQAAATGGSAVITATYPTKAIAGSIQAVPGVGFESTIAIPISAANFANNPAACLVPAAPAPPPAPAAPPPSTQPVPLPVPAAPPVDRTPAPAPPPPPTPTGQGPRNVTVTGNPVEALVQQLIRNAAASHW